MSLYRNYPADSEFTLPAAEVNFTGIKQRRWIIRKWTHLEVTTQSVGPGHHSQAQQLVRRSDHHSMI
jgi:hypothetical protein